MYLFYLDKKLLYSFRRLCSHGKPIFCAIEVQVDHLVAGLVRNGVVCANLFDRLAVASCACIGDHNVVKREIATAKSSKANTNDHFC